jgi:hypothetical protein
MSTLAIVLKGGSVLIEALHQKYDQIIADIDSTNYQAFDQQYGYDNGYYCDREIETSSQVDNVCDCSYEQSGGY